MLSDHIICTLLLNQAIDRFRGNEHSVLIATDVAARGLDIPGVRTVVHFQLPHSAEVCTRLCSLLNIIITLLTRACYCYCFRFIFTEVEEQHVLLQMAAVLH